MDQYWKAREAKTEHKEIRTRQLEYLTAGAGSLEEAPKRRSTVGIMETHRELSISLGKFKTSWLESVVGKVSDSGLGEVLANRAKSSKTTLTGESRFEPGSLVTGSKRVVQWTSETW